MLTAVNGFRKTGISPLNPEVIDDWMFEPLETTNKSLPEMDFATPNLNTKRSLKYKLFHFKMNP